MINGITKALIQKKTTTLNEIHEREATWEDVDFLFGWMDLQSGDSNYSNYYAKTLESTHVFVSDFKKLDERVNSNDCRMIVNGSIYDIKFIDNPMELNRQLEIYLKYEDEDNGR